MSYLKNRTQATEVESSFSELLNIIYGIPEGSILVLLLFIIYFCGLFIVNKNVNFSSQADDTTPFITGMRFEQIIPGLKSILSDIPQCFMNNSLKANAGKFHLFFSSSLREKWPNMEYFLVRIFLYSDWIGDLLRKSPYSVRAQENTDQKILRIWTHQSSGVAQLLGVAIETLKLDSHLPKICVVCFIETPLKMITNAFYFILKALLIFKKFKFLSWLFCHVEKTAWLEG